MGKVVGTSFRDVVLTFGTRASVFSGTSLNMPCNGSVSRRQCETGLWCSSLNQTAIRTGALPLTKCCHLPAGTFGAGNGCANQGQASFMAHVGKQPGVMLLACCSTWPVHCCCMVL